MFRALLVLLLPVVSPSKRYDFFPDRPSNWKSYQKQMWLTRQRNSTILLAATDQREHWGMDTAPWEMVELIDSQCPDHGCDTSITVQNTVLVRDNCPPEVRNVTMRVHGHFEKQGPVGKKGDFIEALKALLRASHDPLQTEYVEVSGQFVGTGNISETCYRAIYTAPRVIVVSMDTKRATSDSGMASPFIDVEVDGGTERRLPDLNGFCKQLVAMRKDLVQYMFDKLGTKMAIGSLACILPVK